MLVCWCAGAVAGGGGGGGGGGDVGVVAGAGVGVVMAVMLKNIPTIITIVLIVFFTGSCVGGGSKMVPCC